MALGTPVAGGNLLAATDPGGTQTVAKMTDSQLVSLFVGQRRSTRRCEDQPPTGFVQERSHLRADTGATPVPRGSAGVQPTPAPDNRDPGRPAGIAAQVNPARASKVRDEQATSHRSRQRAVSQSSTTLKTAIGSAAPRPALKTRPADSSAVTTDSCLNASAKAVQRTTTVSAASDAATTSLVMPPVSAEPGQKETPAHLTSDTTRLTEHGQHNPKQPEVSRGSLAAQAHRNLLLLAWTDLARLFHIQFVSDGRA